MPAAPARFTAARCQGPVQELGGAGRPRLPGHRVKPRDGNPRAATRKRWRATRGHRAGPLPGRRPVVLDPALMLITDVSPCADAAPQEGAVVEPVLPTAAAGDAGVEDRTFCTVDSLAGVAGRRADFVVRRPADLTVEPAGEDSPAFATEAGGGGERRARVAGMARRCWGHARPVCAGGRRPRAAAARWRA